MTIIIPTYNERDNIKPLISEIRSAVGDVAILFVDDASPDGTAHEIKEMQAKDINIMLIERSGKYGLASAYVEAFSKVFGINSPGPIVTMDGDLSHPAEALKDFQSKIADYDLVVGSRYTLGGSISNWSFGRRLLSRVGNWYEQALNLIPIKDATSGFMMIRPEVLKKVDLSKLKTRGYAFLIELKYALLVSGATSAEVPIRFTERRSGKSKFSFSIVLEALLLPFRLNSTLLFGVIIFAVSLSVYIITLPRTIFWGDSSEFIASAASLGIPHPPGYPAYVLLAHLFTLLPFANVAFRVGLFSALCGSLSLVLIYLLFQRIFKNHLLATSVALTLGFSELFWSQAIMAKVYTPMLFAVLAILWLLFKYLEEKNWKYLATSCLLFGLGAGMHPIVLLFLPTLLIALILHLSQISNLRTTRFHLSPLLLCLMLFITGLGVFVYLPIREHAGNNFYDFSKIFHSSNPGSSFSQFKGYVLRTDYGDYGGKFIWRDKMYYLSSFLQNLWRQFYWLTVLLPIGLIWLWLYRRRVFYLTASILFLNVFLIIFLRSSEWNWESEFLNSFYYLPAYSMAILCIGAALGRIYEISVDKPKFRRIVKLAGLVIITIIPITLFLTNYRTQNLSRFTFVEEYTRGILTSLPSHSILLANYIGGSTDTVEFGLHYQQIINHLRPDVDVLTSLDIHPEADRKVVALVYDLKNTNSARYQLINYVLRSGKYKDRPIYTTYMVDKLGQKTSWTQASNGLVYKFYIQPPALTDQIEYNQINYNQDLHILNSSLFGKDLVAQYFYAQAAYWVGKKDLRRAEESYILGIRYDYKVMGLDQESFINFRDRVFGRSSL